MKIGILFFGLAASLASALPAQNQTTVSAIPARNSTHTSSHAVSAEGCISSTLRWKVGFPGLNWRVHNYFEFKVGDFFFEKLPVHPVSLDYEKWCSDDWRFCVTHANGQFTRDLTIMFNGYDYYHSAPSRINYKKEYDWDYEYWDCVV